MQFYIAVVHKEEASAYGLGFPDLPGCFSAADSWDEVLAKATEALDLYFEDAEPVTPRSIGEIRDDPEVAAALAEGAVLMPIPYVPAEGRQVRANISLDRGLLRAIDEVAARRRMTRSSFLASLARREITGI